MRWGLQTPALPLPLQHLQRLCHPSSWNVWALSAGRFPASGHRGIFRPLGTRALHLGPPALRVPWPPLPVSQVSSSLPCPLNPGLPESLRLRRPRSGCSSGPTNPGPPHSPASGAEGSVPGLRHQRSSARAGSRLTAQRSCFTHSTDCRGSAAPIAPIAAGAASSAGRGARGRRGRGTVSGPCSQPGGVAGRRRCVTRYAERAAGTRGGVWRPGRRRPG